LKTAPRYDIFTERFDRGSTWSAAATSIRSRERTLRFRLSAFLAVVLVALSVAGSAFAFDCIRVSSSLQGLRQSTSSGKWLLFDFSSASGTAATLANVGLPVDSATAQCVYASYSASGQSPYFALGTGVAGGDTNGPGVLAHNNPNGAVLGNGKGVDHLDDSQIFPALASAIFGCTGIDITG
jgi:hypothetical protein